MANNSKELAERLYHSLPKIYRYLDRDNKEQLKRFLEIASAGGLYPSYRDTRNLLGMFDIDKVPTEYLPQLASALGFTFPYKLDHKTQRTYIKNAVRSYRMKGTESALLFMLRELTRFKTWFELDKPNRHIDLFMEVDMGRQDYDQIVEIAEYLLMEYAPPLKSYEIVNIFLWLEDVQRRVTENVSILDVKILDSYERKKDIGLWYSDDILKMLPDNETWNSNITADEDFLDLRHFFLFIETPYTPKVTEFDKPFIISSEDIENYDRNSIISQYGYAIIDRDEGNENNLLNAEDTILTFTLHDFTQEVANLKSNDDYSVIHTRPTDDNEDTFLNKSEKLKTSPIIEHYSVNGIHERTSGTIYYPDGTNQPI